MVVGPLHTYIINLSHTSPAIISYSALDTMPARAIKVKSKSTAALIIIILSTEYIDLTLLEENTIHLNNKYKLVRKRVSHSVTTTMIITMILLYYTYPMHLAFAPRRDQLDLLSCLVRQQLHSEPSGSYQFQLNQ